ncbi:netrin receptor UNC5C-like, partial [Anneissia japonica]|uniref:netrin receptor UNC5C-like n=1 Tax=Anneissia japonica TaxID=1529436 RepID=UPI00142591FD
DSTEVATPPRPVFTLQPKSGYLVNDNPVRIECRAQPTSTIQIKCFGELVPIAEVEVLTTFDESSQQIQHVAYEVTKAAVHSHFGEYSCQCTALGQGNIEENSRKAIIQVAYLRKYFTQEPRGITLEIKTSAELLCIPPLGNPSPDVYWEKDSQLVDLTSDNYIMRSEGHLIINHAVLENTGNYTCVAGNLAAKRKSNTAEVIVYGKYRP